MLVGEHAGHGVYHVLYVCFRRKRRGVTLVGAKQIEKHYKALERSGEESNQRARCRRTEQMVNSQRLLQMHDSFSFLLGVPLNIDIFAGCPSSLFC